MDFFVLGFFLKQAAKGFLIAIFIRFLYSLITKSDMSFGGLIRSGIFGALVYVIIIYVYINSL